MNRMIDFIQSIKDKQEVDNVHKMMVTRTVNNWKAILAADAARTLGECEGDDCPSDNMVMRKAMAKDCLRVCADGSCADPLRETHKAAAACNRGDNDVYVFDEDDLLAVVNELPEGVEYSDVVDETESESDSDNDVLVMDEDDLLEVINERRLSRSQSSKSQTRRRLM
jgi:uncharacterized protein with ATP-grasp and redox domains